MQNTSATAIPATDDWQLQYEKNASGSWSDVVSAVEVPADQYTGTNSNTAFGASSFDRAKGQSFLGNGKKLTKVSFPLSRPSGSANVGSLFATVYAHTGTYGGGTATPTGTALATSTNTIDAQTGVTTTPTYYDFTFDGTFTLTSGTPYFVVVDTSASLGAGVNDGVYLGNNLSGTHPGNRAGRNTTGTWAGATGDFGFKVWAGPFVPGTTALTYDSPNLTNGEVTTNRLTGGTGTFAAGKVSEDAVMDDLGWAGNNYTELVYALLIKAS